MDSHLPAAHKPCGTGVFWGWKAEHKNSLAKRASQFNIFFPAVFKQPLVPPCRNTWEITRHFPIHKMLSLSTDLSFLADNMHEQPAAAPQSLSPAPHSQDSSYLSEPLKAGSLQLCWGCCPLQHTQNGTKGQSIPPALMPRGCSNSSCLRETLRKNKHHPQHQTGTEMEAVENSAVRPSAECSGLSKIISQVTRDWHLLQGKH